MKFRLEKGRPLSEDPFSFWGLCASLYLLLSILGTLFISDEFDSLKIEILSFLAIPLLSLIVIVRWQLPTVYEYFRPYFIFIAVVLGLAFSPGVLASLNALGSYETVRNQRTVIEDQEFSRKSHLGLLGVPFHVRKF